MELRYCEECGDVIRAEATDPLTIADRFVCDKCHSGAKVERAGDADPSAPETHFDSSRLNLFSPDTVAIHKRQYQEELTASPPKSTRLQLVQDGPSAEAEGAASPGESSTSAAGAKAGQKVLFRCLHCKSTLSIRQVDRTSRLTCPHCGKAIYVTASGRLYKSSPPSTMKKGEGLLQDRPSAEPPTVPTEGGVGSTAVRRTTPAGSTAVRRTTGAESTTVKSTTGGKSVALKKVGSQAAPRAGQSSRRLEATRPQATASPDAVAPEILGGVKPPPAKTGSSRKALAPETGEIHAGPTATQVGLTNVNPASGWTPKPPSAFEEHQASQSPEKTVFITDEPTADLSALAGSSLLSSAEPFSDPEAPGDIRLDLPTEAKDLVGSGEDLARELVSSEPRTQAPSPRAASPARARLQLPRRVVDSFVRAVFLTAFLCAPLFIVGGLLPPRVSAEAGVRGSPGSAHDFLERMGEVAIQGIHKLVAAQKP